MAEMLHEMRAGEMGSLIVSTPILPRYKIGDLILAFRPPYFRIFSKTWGGCRSDLLSDRTAVSKTALQSSSPPEY